MTKEFFNENEIAKIVQNSMAKIIGTEYGIRFENHLFIPEDLAIKQVQDLKIKNLESTITDFKNLWNELKFYSSVQRIPKSSLYHFSRMQPIQGYSNPLTDYYLYLQVFYFGMLKTKNKKCLSYKDFVKHFMEFLLENANFVSLSKFMTSNLASIHHTGLAYKLINETVSIERINEYLMDSHLPVFQNLCLLHNFLIDGSLPWTIVHRIKDNFAIENSSMYINIYANESKILQTNIHDLWTKYFEEELSEKDKQNIFYLSEELNFNEYRELFIKIKAKEQKIELTKEQIMWINVWWWYNTIHNGEEDSIFKLSNMKQNGNSLSENWRQVFNSEYTTITAYSTC